MPHSPPCPSVDVLDRYLDDRLPVADTPGFEAHLKTCPTCEDRLRKSLRSDPLLPLARPLRNQPALSHTVPEGLRTRLLGLYAGSPDTPNLTADLDTPPVTVSEPLVAEIIGFLQPAEVSGELGRLGGYRILRVLGRGGMGIVCLAEDPELHRLVAIKVIRPGMATDSRAVAWFLREARALAALAHENIVTVFQRGHEGKTLFLVMEFLEGETVAEWMNKHPSRRLGDALRIAREAADGLAYAHSKGVLHRDLKPANLWRTAERGQVKLLDFGLARDPSGDTLMQPGDRYGTPAYMAPEQVHGQAADHRADLFSLGVVLHELVAGTAPFSRPRVDFTLAAVTNHHPMPVNHAHPWLPAELAELTTRLLAKDPTARVASASEAAAALRRIEDAATKAGLLERMVGVPTASESEAITTEVLPLPEEEADPQTPRWKNWQWVAALAFGLVAAIGLGQIIIRVTREDGKKEDIAVGPKDKVEVIRDGKSSPITVIDPPPPPPSGAPLSKLALTQKPKVLQGALGHTLETTRFRERFYVAQFQPGGTLLATGGEDGTVRLYDTKTWKLTKAFVRSPVEVGELAWTPDGKQLVVYSLREKTRIWDVETGKLVRELPGGVSITVSPDGKFLASASTSITVVSLGQDATTVELAEPDTFVECLSWNRDSKRLTAGYRDGMIRIWDVAQKKVDRDFKSGFAIVSHVSWSPDGKKLAASRDGYGIAIWFGEKRVAPKGGRATYLSSWLNGGDALAYTSATDWPVCRVLDTTRDDGAFVDLDKTQDGNKAAYHVTASADSKLLALVAKDFKSARVIDRAGKIVHTFTEAPGLSYNPEGHYRNPEQGQAEVVYVVQTKDGQETLTPAEFEKKYGWKNDPDKVLPLGK